MLKFSVPRFSKNHRRQRTVEERTVGSTIVSEASCGDENGEDLGRMEEVCSKICLKTEFYFTAFFCRRLMSKRFDENVHFIIYFLFGNEREHFFFFSRVHSILKIIIHIKIKNIHNFFHMIFFRSYNKNKIQIE
jgi:hypothetical protein